MTPVLVLVTYYARHDLLPETLRSVHGWPVRVLDDSPTGLPIQVSVPVLRVGAGGGFARAANQGLRHARQQGYPWVLLLNDDAAPQPGCVERLLQVMQADARVAAVGPVLRTVAGEVESAGIRYHASSGRVQGRRRVPAVPTDVDALSGACLLLDSQVRFDGRFRFSFEDIELCQRLRAAGRRVLVVPDAICVHRGGATVPRRSPLATRRAVEGHLRLVGASPLRRALVVGLALAQVARQGGGRERFGSVLEGACSW